MNKEWSDLNKKMQQDLKKEITFTNGITTLIYLRDNLMEEVYAMRNLLTQEQFNALPYINANGYHNKTIAYSIWHIFRIEDIVTHTLILDKNQILFTNDYQKSINSPIITTGNELVKLQISEFSSQLDLEKLYQYSADVKKSTETMLEELTYKELKTKISSQRKHKLESLNVVSNDDKASWLIDYWCNKDIRGLIQMPYSRHWIMHVEACLRIKAKLVKD